MTGLAWSLAVAGFLLSFGGCSAGRHHEVSGAEFARLAGMPIGSAVDSRFIGATEHRAWLSVWSALPTIAGGGTDVYSVEIEDLPPEIALKIRSGVNPWPK